LLVHTSRAFFLFYWSAARRELPSFPTRRSSDLDRAGGGRPALPRRGARRRGGGARRRRTAQLPAAAATGPALAAARRGPGHARADRKSTRLNSSHVKISYAVFCLKKKNNHSIYR